MNIGKVTFDCYDTAGQEKFGRLHDGYYEGTDAAIIMFDVTQSSSYKSVGRWYADITRVCKNIPVVLCGNKVDDSVKRQVILWLVCHNSR